MNKVSKLGQVAHLVFYVTLQIIIARYIVPLHTVSCFVYVSFLLSLPQQNTNLLSLLLLSFIVGLLIDIFYDSLGIHAFSSVLLIYSRALLLKYMFPSGKYALDNQPTLRNLGLRNFTIFFLILTFIHHTALFSLDAWNSTLLGLGLRKAAASTLLTYASVLIVQGFSIRMGRR